MSDFEKRIYFDEASYYMRQFRQNLILLLVTMLVLCACASAVIANNPPITHANTPGEQTETFELPPTDEVEPTQPAEPPTDAVTATPPPPVTEAPQEPTPPVEPPTDTPDAPTQGEEPTTSPDDTPSGTPEATHTPTPSAPTPTSEISGTPTPTPYMTVIPPDEEVEHYVPKTDIKASVGKLSTVRIDGREETFWSYCNEFTLNNVILGDADTAATFKAAWDSEYLYLFVKVTDDTYDVSSDLYTRKDGIEIFFNESNAKTEEYATGDQHYQIARDGNIQYGNGASENLIRYKVIETEDGYLAEIAIAFVLEEGARDSVVGLDIRINDSFGEGKRDFIVQWSDTTLLTYTNLSKIGTLILR